MALYKIAVVIFSYTVSGSLLLLGVYYWKSFALLAWTVSDIPSAAEYLRN